MSVDLTQAVSALNTQRAPALQSAQTQDELLQKAAEFEGVFLNQMFQTMFSTLGEDSLYGGGSGNEVWRSLIVNEYASSMANSGGIGLADTVKEQLLQLQEI